MVDTLTNNRNLVQPQVGGDSGTWGNILNSGVMAQLDLILGATQAITITVADVTLTVPQWNNAAINLTGALTGDRSLILPFNSNSSTIAVGGLFVVANNTTGAFKVTVKTSAAAVATGITGLGTVTGGTLYTNGTYTSVPLTGGSGSGAVATVVVAGNAVTSVQITSPGSLYAVGNTLSAASASIGGTGSGFSVQVTSVGGTGVTIPQGLRAFLYSDTINVWYADDSRVQMIEFSGNPTGLVAGVAGSINGPPTIVWDYTNSILYFCTTTGTISTAVWSAINVPQTGLPLPAPEGYLTPVSNTAIITSDSISASTIYYTPYVGSWAAVHNGTSIIPYQFTQKQLTLSSSQAASNIYDVFLAYNSGSPVIGTGPSWAASGGSITAGSCARGAGTGSTAISRDGTTGLWVNTNSMSLIYNTGAGNNTVTVGAGQGVYLGSLFIDTTAGQVTCHRSYGQSRKWGISNAYNQVPVYLKAGDNTANWSDNVGTFKAANSNTANSLTIFSGLSEQVYGTTYDQGADGAGAGFPQIGIGYNSTTTTSGFIATTFATSAAGPISIHAMYLAPPALGINVITALVRPRTSVGVVYYGTETNMVLGTTWMA